MRLTDVCLSILSMKQTRKPCNALQTQVGTIPALRENAYTTPRQWRSPRQLTSKEAETPNLGLFICFGGQRKASNAVHRLWRTPRGSCSRTKPKPCQRRGPQLARQ